MATDHRQQVNALRSNIHVTHEDDARRAIKS
jgi:hypothetical protein